MSDNAPVGPERYLTFTVAKELFAIPITSVREILDMAEITRIPQMPQAMRGVVNVRGTAVPVVDLGLRFGSQATEHTVNTRIIIVEIPTAQSVVTLGAIADSVKEVLELDPASIAPPPPMGTKVGTAFLRGIGKRDETFILLVDIDKVLRAEEISMLDQVGQNLNPQTAAPERAAPGQDQAGTLYAGLTDVPQPDVPMRYDPDTVPNQGLAMAQPAAQADRAG